MQPFHQLKIQSELEREILFLSHLERILKNLNETKDSLLIESSDLNSIWIYNNSQFNFLPQQWNILVLLNDCLTVESVFECEAYSERVFEFPIPTENSIITVYLESALFRLNVYETSLDELDLFVVPVNYIPIAITSSFKSTQKSLPFPITIDQLIKPKTKQTQQTIKNEKRAIGKLKEKNWELIIEEDFVKVSGEQEIFDILLQSITKRIDKLTNQFPLLPLSSFPG